MKRCWVIVWMAAATMPAGAQTPVRGTWETFTDLTTVRSVAAVRAAMYAATGGGLFWVDLETGTVASWTNAVGLTSNDLTAVAVDNRDNIWVGAADGALDVLRPGERPVSLSDIRDSNRLLKRIQRFVPRSDTLFIVSQFGVSVYRLDRDEFADTYSSFGYVTQPVCWDVAIARDTVWVASDHGIAAAPVNSPNLSSPTSWIRLGIPDGLPSENVRSLLSVGDTLLVGTTSGTVARINGAFVTHPSLGSVSTVRLVRVGSRISALTFESGASVVSMLGSALGGRTIAGPPIPGTAADVAIMDETGDPVLGFAGLGIGTLSAGNWTWTMPNAPGSNLFMSVAVDGEGTVWAGTGFNGGGRGFMRFRRSDPAGSRWKTFSVAGSPGLLTDDYYKVNPVNDGSVWISSWGAGAVQVVQDTLRRRIDHSTTPSLAGTVLSNPAFVVVGSIADDAQGKTWFVNRTAIDRNYLARLDDDSTFTKYSHPTLSGLYTAMVIDRNGTKWLANSEPTSKTSLGLTYFNESGQISGTSGNGGWGTFTESDGLADNSVMCLAVDQDGDVWAGTDLGVTIFSEPSNPRIRRSSSFPLREQSIQSIAVDGVNNKWAGTKEGVFVVSPDGSQLIAQYTVTNTGGKLVSNDVRSVAIDQVRGIVYLGTEAGMSALAIDPVQPERRYSTLVIGPNPFRVPSQEPLTIRGLVPRSRIKILGIAGLAVTEFEAQGGGRAFWDGRDRQGRLVGSGTYLIVAFNENGEQLTTGKVAVVRR